MVPPDPLEKSTTTSLVPVSSVNCGVPVTVTASENVIVMAITSPALYDPLAVEELMLDTLAIGSANENQLWYPSTWSSVPLASES